jgi:hypothetical protein
MIGLVAGTASAVAGDGPADLSHTPERSCGGLTGGAQSTRQLVDELLRALRASDEDALRHLRVTEAEYRNLVIPGHVPPGEPPRPLTPEWRDYAWANLEGRSHYHELRLLHEFGGEALTVKAIRFENGEKQYAGYKAYSQLRLTVQDGDGKERELRTGSIAQIGGTFKFISFIRD